MRTIVFRFDVDTHIGAIEGVPRLLALADRLDVRFTFFVNMGRAVSYRHVLGRLVNKSSVNATAPKLSNWTKLGGAAYLRTLLLNQAVGTAIPEVLAEAARSGHDIGLHGGRNHGTWQADATQWTNARVVDELSYGIERFTTAVGTSPESFSSPGWTQPPGLGGLLHDFGFVLVADRHGPGDVIVENPVPGVKAVSTNLTGEPAGVGYVETMASRGVTTSRLGQVFANDVEPYERAVVYDHPAFAGRAALGAVETLVETARARGFRWITMRQMAEGL